MWQDIENVSDLQQFFLLNPFFGLLGFDHRKQVTLFHSLVRKKEEPDTYTGTFGNSLEVSPVEITFHQEMFRTYQVKPKTTEASKDPPTEKKQTDHHGPDQDPTPEQFSPPNQFKNMKCFFLVPPAHVTHLLDHATGIFKSAEDLDSWLTTKILSTPPLSSDGYHHFDGFTEFWSQTQIWIQTISQAKSFPFAYTTVISEPHETESYFLAHIPEDLMVPPTFEIQTNPANVPITNRPPTIVDITNRIPTIVEIPTTVPADVATVTQHPPSQVTTHRSNVNPGRATIPTYQPQPITDPAPMDFTTLMSQIAGEVLNPAAPKKKKRRTKSKPNSTTNADPPPGQTTATAPADSVNLLQPTDAEKARTDEESVHDSISTEPDQNAAMMSQLLKLMILQQAQAQADQARAKAEAEQIRIEQNLAQARAREEEHRQNRETREANERTQRELRESNEQSNRELRDLIQLQASQLNTLLVQVTNNRIERESPNDSKNAKKIWNKLQTSVQLSFTRGSAIDESIEPAEPYETCMLIYNNTDKHTAQTVFLNHMATVRGRYHPGQLANLIWSGPFWEFPGEPETLTVFAMHAKSEAFQKHTKAAKMAAIKVDYDHHVDKEEIDTLYQKELNFPTEVHDFLKMIKGFTQVLSILYGPESILCKIVHAFYLHAFENDDEYATLATANPHNLSKVLYGLDLAVQNTLLMMGDPDEPFGPNLYRSLRTELDKMKHDLAHRHNFSISFPQGFTAELRGYLQKIKDKEPEKKGGAKPGANAAGGKAGKGQKQEGAAAVQGLVNPNPNPAWKLPDGIDYAAAFWAPEAKGKAPKHENKSFCLNYFILGRCKQGCQRYHTDPRSISPEMDKAFTDFCKAQYERCKKRKQLMKRGARQSIRPHRTSTRTTLNVHPTYPNTTTHLNQLRSFPPHYRTTNPHP